MAHICQVLYSGLGGHGAVAFPLAAGFRERGHEVSLLFFGVDPVLASYRERGVPYREVRKRPGLDLGAWRAVARHLEELRPDCLLTHGCATAPAAWWYRWRRGARWVVRETQANQLKTRRERWLTLLGALGSHAMVYLTPEYRAEMGRFPGRSRIIPNGVDLSIFRPGSPPGPPWRLGMVSRMTPIKDHPTLLRAVRELPGEWTLDLAGEGSEREPLERLTRELGLQERVRFRGLLDGPAVAELLRGLDVYVHATLGETMSTSIQQALATGLPVLASDVPGVANMLSPGTTGWLAPARDPAAWTRALERLLGDAPLRESLGRSARRQAEREYGLETQVTRYLECFGLTPERPPSPLPR